MPQKIDETRMASDLPWRYKLVEKPFDSRADTFQSADRVKEWAKLDWAHRPILEHDSRQP